MNEEYAIESMQEDIDLLEKELEIYKLALREAGKFCHKRLPHDAREQGSTPEYFENMLLDCAKEQYLSLRQGRQAKNEPEQANPSL